MKVILEDSTKLNPDVHASPELRTILYIELQGTLRLVQLDSDNKRFLQVAIKSPDINTHDHDRHANLVRAPAKPAFELYLYLY